MSSISSLNTLVSKNSVNFLAASIKLDARIRHAGTETLLLPISNPFSEKVYVCEIMILSLKSRSIPGCQDVLSVKRSSDLQSGKFVGFDRFAILFSVIPFPFRGLSSIICRGSLLASGPVRITITLSRKSSVYPLCNPIYSLVTCTSALCMYAMMRGADSNRRPPGYEPSELPLLYPTCESRIDMQDDYYLIQLLLVKSSDRSRNRTCPRSNLPRIEMRRVS